VRPPDPHLTNEYLRHIAISFNVDYVGATSEEPPVRGYHINVPRCERGTQMSRTCMRHSLAQIDEILVGSGSASGKFTALPEVADILPTPPTGNNRRPPGGGGGGGGAVALPPYAGSIPQQQVRSSATSSCEKLDTDLTSRIPRYVSLGVRASQPAPYPPPGQLPYPVGRAAHPHPPEPEVDFPEVPIGAGPHRPAGPSGGGGGGDLADDDLAMDELSRRFEALKSRAKN